MPPSPPPPFPRVHTQILCVCVCRNSTITIFPGSLPRVLLLSLLLPSCRKHCTKNHKLYIFVLRFYLSEECASSLYMFTGHSLMSCILLLLFICYTSLSIYYRSMLCTMRLSDFNSSCQSLFIKRFFFQNEPERISLCTH